MKANIHSPYVRRKRRTSRVLRVPRGSDSWAEETGAITLTVDEMHPRDPGTPISLKSTWPRPWTSNNPESWLDLRQPQGSRQASKIPSLHPQLEPSVTCGFTPVDLGALWA